MSSPARDHLVSTPTATSGNTAPTGYRIRRNTLAAAPLDLIRPDGSVLIPAAVAREVLRALTRDLTARVRTDGGEVTPEVRRLLYALHVAAQSADIEHSSDIGTAPSPADTVATFTEVSVGEAAALLGCTTGYVRRLARAGAFTARRIGARTWAIDRAALDQYRHGGSPG
ncbi:helix-turn-helix domain-containing protein [Streptomyces antibioticus]|uniref:helix-turn-helix domain-containing protein n=1 Tax=Streptomyces antibioticus TaxID=1890 RepID=UPI0036C77725